jgi:alpha-beta hydrolase superfamily lysophospholipase
MKSSSPAALRIDRERGIQVSVEFLDAGPDRMIGFLHTPLEPPRGGVVLCSSLHAEMMGNYRKEVLLAERLAERGVAVQRFHYRGTGNSGGSDADVTLDSMQDDARLWCQNLVDKTSVADVGYFGVRFGALAAAGAAHAFQEAPVAFWQPVLDPQLYFREIFRSQLMRELKSGKAPGPGPTSLDEKLTSAGIADVLGYSIHETLYKSTLDRLLSDELGRSPRAALIVQIAWAAELTSDLATLVTGWEGGGWRTSTHVEVHEPAWWFVGEDWKAEELREETTALVETTAGWLADQLAGDRP